MLNNYRNLSVFFRHSAALMPVFMIPFGIFAKFGILNRDYYTNDTIFALIVATYSLLSIAYFILIYKIGSNKIPIFIFTITFHVLTMLYLLFVSGFLSTFLAVWILLIVSANLFFGSKGFTLSFLALCLAAYLGYLIHPNIPTEELLEMIQGTLIIAFVGYIIVQVRNITESERKSLARVKEQELFQRERLLTLVNSMGDAVVTTDESGSIKVYNAALISLLDTNASLVGKNIDEVLELCSRKGDKTKIIDDARAIHKVFSRTDLIRGFGTEDEVKLYINVAPIRPDYQSSTERGFIFIIRDITKEKTLEEERDEFISVVSHELRTPVAIAEGNLSNLIIMQERKSNPQTISQATSEAHEQIVYLAKMINDLSTLSRAERGINTEGTEEIDTQQMLQSLYKTYLPEAEKKNLRLNLDLSPALPKVRSSKLYIEEILQNFVTNAIKYTEEGSVTIIGHNTSYGVFIAVKDTGIGISKTDQRRIFEKFYRSEDYRTRESAGTGLGLYISQKLANKLNLTINFESRLNHGSTFSIILKTAKDNKPKGASKS